MKFFKLIGLIAGMLISYNAQSNIVKETYIDFKSKVSDTWNNYEQYDLYVPVITWHNRWFYDEEKIEEYNEKPYGLGVGVSKYDDKGNWNSLYVMAFKDSHNKFEPIGGFAWEKIWRPYNNDFELGLGYTAVITARNDWYHYKLPVPGVLPLASVGYKNLTFQSTYIPGTYNNGNVFFAWFKYQF